MIRMIRNVADWWRDCHYARKWRAEKSARERVEWEANVYRKALVSINKMSPDWMRDDRLGFDAARSIARKALKEAWNE